MRNELFPTYLTELPSLCAPTLPAVFFSLYFSKLNKHVLYLSQVLCADLSIDQIKDIMVFSFKKLPCC